VSLDRMLAKPIGRLRGYTDPKEVEDDLFKTTSWVRWQTNEGKVCAELDDVAAVLVPAALATGLVDEERARHQVERGWTWVKGAKSTGQKKAPGPRVLSSLRQVQHSVAAPATPTDVRAAVDTLVAVLSDPRVKTKLQSILWDTLGVFEASRGRKPGSAA
jgi:hypothetical protein